MHSADAQIGSMRRDWPTFKLTHRSGGRLVWKGHLRPLGREYLVKIELDAHQYRGFRAGLWAAPRITVLEPIIDRRPADPVTPVPHVYQNKEDPAYPRLCVHDPQEREWHGDCLIAHTIVPWTSEWLACYEVWRATGIWVGGGRHPAPPPKEPG